MFSRAHVHACTPALRAKPLFLARDPVINFSPAPCALPLILARPFQELPVAARPWMRSHPFHAPVLRTRPLLPAAASSPVLFRPFPPFLQLPIRYSGQKITCKRQRKRPCRTLKKDTPISKRTQSPETNRTPTASLYPPSPQHDSLSGPLPGGRAQGALCVERPFLTSSIMELRVSQVKRLLQSTSRVPRHPLVSGTTILPAALASVSFVLVVVRVRVRYSGRRRFRRRHHNNT
jgi:hypothetical protein